MAIRLPPFFWTRPPGGSFNARVRSDVILFGKTMEVGDAVAIKNMFEALSALDLVQLVSIDICEKMDLGKAHRLFEVQYRLPLKEHGQWR